MREIVRRAAFLFAAALVAPSVAWSNGRFPQAQQVVIGPGPGRSDVVALRVTFGVLLSTDGGRNFGWICEDGLYYPLVPAFNYDPSVELSASGALVFGFENGIRSTADGCTTTDVTGTSRHAFADLTSDPTGNTLFAIESTPGVPATIWRMDRGLSEVSRYDTGMSDVRFDTIEVAPSNARRLYLTGRAGAEFRPVFYRSDDGGRTVTPLEPDAGAADSMWVSGVDPRDPDTLYVRATVGLGTELRRSRDGGRSFHRIASTPDPMLGFAISDDGRTVWIGSIEAGLLRSDDGGESFRPVNRLPILCLRQHAGVLWACSDWVSQPFALGRSRDQGATFEPMLHLTNFSNFQGPPACGVRSEGAEVCVERWPVFQRELTDGDLLYDAGPLPSGDGGLRRDAAADVSSPRDGGAEAGVMDATTPRDGGVVTSSGGVCNCTVPGRGTAPDAPAALAVAAVLAATRRRRGRSSSGA